MHRGGPADEGGRHPGPGPDGWPGPAHGPQGALPGGGPAGEPVTPDRVRAILGDAGYTQVGQVTQDGPRTLVEAVSPEGNPVTVTVNPRGVVVRELAR